jgi:trigger factor
MRPIPPNERKAPVITNKSIEKLEHSSVKLSVTVPSEESKKEYDAMMREYSKNVRIDGFRQGHVPVSVLERKFGDSLRLDAMGRVMEKAVQEALKDTDVKDQPLAYSTPSLDGEPDFAIDKDFSFAVKYDVFPTIEVGDWKGIEVSKPTCQITVEDEERELKEIRERNAIVVERDAEAKAAKGDIVTVNFREIGADGQTVAGTERQDFTFEIGTGYNVYKIDDEMVGMKRDEEKTIEKTYPADFDYNELAGKTVKLAIKLTKIKEKKLPELDDELAQDVSENYKTLADLKADIRKNLEKKLADKLKQLEEKALVEGLLARSKTDLPESMVAAELSMRLENLKRQMGIENEEQLARVLAYSGKSAAALVEEWKPSAEKAITTRLALEKLTEEGKYECTDADLEAEFARQAAEASLSIDEVKAEYEKRGSMEYLKDRVKEDKLMADLLSAAKVKNGDTVAFVDLLKDSE